MAQYFPLARHIHDSTGSGIVAYDQYGCGQSPKPESWESYNFGRLADDLAAVFEWTRSRDWHNRRQIVVVAHSYGTHLALRLALDLRAERSPDSCPGNGGARNSSKKSTGPASLAAADPTTPRRDGQCAVRFVLLAGCLSILDGGHPLFLLPVFALNWLQSTLTRGFLAAAYEAGADPEMLADQERAANANPLSVCKAYYRQVLACI